MGFPDIDIWLVDKMKIWFDALKASPDFILNDTFSSLSDTRRANIKAYVVRKKYTTDLRDRDNSTGQVFIFNHFPLSDTTLPQIAINLGSETPTEDFIGYDDGGGSTPVIQKINNVDTVVAYDSLKTYFFSTVLNIDVVAATKDESVWLSRLVQRFICDSFLDMSAVGVYEQNVSLADMKLMEEHQPLTAFNRRVTLTCSGKNTWTLRTAAATYKTGINKGI